MTTCRTEFESESGCRIYFDSALQADADKALDELYALANRYSFTHKKTSGRLRKLFEIGRDIYDSRFPKIWMPF